MKQSQYSRIAKLLTKKAGTTAMEITSVASTVSPHSRLAEMRSAGWLIWREAIDGKNYGRYFGSAPKGV